MLLYDRVNYVMCELHEDISKMPRRAENVYNINCSEDIQISGGW